MATAGGGGTDGSRSAVRTRSDHISFVSLDEDERSSGVTTRGDWSALAEVARRVDSLAARLAEAISGRGSTVARHQPQVARYGCGDAYARHCDNHCPASDDGGSSHGPHCNGRYLTIIYYASHPAWTANDGECLRLYRPQGVDTLVDANSADDDTGAYEDDARIDIAPLEDRVLVFFSDFRCPHAVLAVTSTEHARYAATFWYSIRR